MCQMTLINVDNTKAMFMLAINLMMENSRISNKDGCGIFSPSTGVSKTELAASVLLNLGETVVGKFKKVEPMICHVRAASFSSDKKLLSSEHAHPFESEHYVFQHNGTLSFKNKTDEEKYKDKELIDSEMFLAELEKNYTGDIVVDVNKTMELFYGKFAFMIYHKPEDCFYIIRGRAATLYKTELVVPNTTIVRGLVVNTESISMHEAIMRASNCLQLSGIRLDPTKAELLETETAYKLDGYTLVKLGTVKENDKPVAANFSQNTRPQAAGYSKMEDGYLTKIIKYMVDWGLGPEDMDELAMVLIGKGFVDFDYEDKTSYTKYLEELERRFNNHLKRKWQEMLISSFGGNLYAIFPELQFPYFLTEPSKFKEIYGKFLIILKEKLNEDHNVQ